MRPEEYGVVGATQETHRPKSVRSAHAHSGPGPVAAGQGRAHCLAFVLPGPSPCARLDSLRNTDSSGLDCWFPKTHCNKAMGGFLVPHNVLRCL